jgi:hypothetical protein
MVYAQNSESFGECVSALEMRRLRHWQDGAGPRGLARAGADKALASARQTHLSAATDLAAFVCDWSLEPKGDLV